MLLRHVISTLATVAYLTAEHGADFGEPRSKAAAEFHDGILLLHANSELSTSADGFRQDPFFYYFTGLENTVGAVLAIDGKSNESWLFLPSHPPFLRDGLQPEVRPGAGAEKRMALRHVVDWSELREFCLAFHPENPAARCKRLFPLRRAAGRLVEHSVAASAGMAAGHFAEMALLRCPGSHQGASTIL